ncbi:MULTISPECIES: MoxR family ATPase [Streptomyces]|uniref:AAA family ATPase n=1 Tax=Streptomyces TaxID=1883 RepID=UPI00103E796E|nr:MULTISPECIES: AAA family ATPase [Streptomyces]MBT3077943.1 AAA family ATPase [Streptomyces sp. COG21]MBT3084787.1 AAA family ATPase [Streptomyces sp. COG20]MBT3085490.1 AAA family ATPase [Streptomyces sp. CYG21]MBT3100311.1 AAA family ATPase [Streptomyces sp. CBG30]MBT3103265.1 AAA family ATPase [Streptomyces sp. COG19]
MTWKPYYRGDGEQREAALADPPPWRTFPRRPQHREYRPPPGLVDAVNAALHLRRPLLVSGPAGSGKSSVIEQVAHELKLGGVLRWHITSRSSLSEALYRYDALGRIHAQSLRSAMSQGATARTGRGRSRDEIGPFLQLGPLGTALVPSEQPRALLVDEIDKSDLDLPSDLLEVLERGEFVIPELVRYRKPRVAVRLWDSDEEYVVERGRVPCTQFPFILLTSNGERDFSPAFLRRCIRYTMPPLTADLLHGIVEAHFEGAPEGSDELVRQFAERVGAGEHLAIDQLLNAVALLLGEQAPSGSQYEELRELVLRELSRA